MSAILSFTPFNTTLGFSPFLMMTMPVTTSSSLSWPTTPRRGTAPIFTWAMSRIRIGVPLRAATTMRPMSSDDCSRPRPRMVYCCAPWRT